MAVSQASEASRGSRASAGILYVVATPIGNLEDITLRALKVLKSVQLVAAEDTRRTGLLLRHFDIQSPVLSVHEHNERARVERITGRLAKGDSVALVTDAGTPGISDPGATLVAAIRKAGFRVEPIPGASAVVTGISASGISSHGFTFLGFPPVRSKDRTKYFADLVEAAGSRLVVFFEAPHKISKTLTELSCLVVWPIIVARELTKVHEEFVEGLPAHLVGRFDNPQGEFTILIPPRPVDASSMNPAENVSDEEVMHVFGHTVEKSVFGSKKDAARAVGERLGLTARQVYSILERNK